MTARELYDTDPGFRGFLAVWDENRRCPLELVDYLLDRDMPAQAECARWAATEEDRDVYLPLVEKGERGGRCGPYPMLHHSNSWAWTVAYKNPNACDIHKEKTNIQFWSSRNHSHRTSTDAIIALMDVWLLPEGESAAERSSSGLLTKQ